MKNKSDGWTVLFSQVTGAAFNLDSFAMINSLCLFHAHNCELGFRTSVRIFDCSLLIPLKALINEVCCLDIEPIILFNLPDTCVCRFFKSISLVTHFSISKLISRSLTPWNALNSCESCCEDLIRLLTKLALSWGTWRLDPMKYNSRTRLASSIHIAVLRSTFEPCSRFPISGIKRSLNISVTVLTTNIRKFSSVPPFSINSLI